MHTQHFTSAFVSTSSHREHLFLSVSPGFEQGPGIQRDGASVPRMRDPHSVPQVTNRLGIRCLRELGPSIDPYVQRAGTWTLYHHLKQFHNLHGHRYRIIAAQSNGDLTMNFWHVAYINRATGDPSGSLCALRTEGDPQEPLASRIYRCLVKWQENAAQLRGLRYECFDLRFEPTVSGRWAIKPHDTALAEELDKCLSSLDGYNQILGDIAPFIEFALSGKPIIEKGVQISLANVIDRFDDVRHIFNLPAVPATGHYAGYPTSTLNLGEHQLYSNINERRAALSSSVVIDLRIGSSVTSVWERVAATLRERLYRETQESPTRRGQFRRYSDDAERDKVEIFFPHNVYPFGLLGLRRAGPQHKDASQIVGLSSGGLSGRVGNTLEGIAQIMFDFFGCADAMVLDEGYDVCSIINPPQGDAFAYSNEDLLRKVLRFVNQQVDMDASAAKESAAKYALGPDMYRWPLNESVLNDIKSDLHDAGDIEDYSDVVIVPSMRSQIRSALIFAAEESGA